jgi:alkyl hydroperoxide reductase subunit AhpC
VSYILQLHFIVAIYRKWIRDIEELQEVKVNIPLVSDPDNGVLLKLGCSKISPFGQNEIIPSSCGLFLIDVDKRIRSSMRYSLNMGKSMRTIVIHRLE